MWEVPPNNLGINTGSGKSSLIHKAFLKKYPNAIVIDQKPVGKSERSNLATYTGVFDLIRKAFSKANKVGASLFSFNSSGLVLYETN